MGLIEWTGKYSLNDYLGNSVWKIGVNLLIEYLIKFTNE